MRRLPRAIVSLCTVALAVRAGEAARLPVRSYTTSEGLARDEVERVYFDSRGFLWVATDEGLSRFDGYRFVNYGTADGLPSDEVFAITETADGTYWVATGDGLCRFDPADARPAAGQPMFSRVSLAPAGDAGLTRLVRALRDDGRGGLWVGTGDGLFHLRANGRSWIVEPVDLGATGGGFQAAQVNAIVTDPAGRTWIATRGLGLFRQHGDRWDRWTQSEGLPGSNIHELLIDPAGWIWAGGSGAARLRCDASPQSRPDIVVTARDGLPSDDVRSLAFAGSGRLFVGTLLGLAEVVVDPTRPRVEVRPLDVVPGRAAAAIMSLVADHDHGLWIGTQGAGLLYLDLAGATRFGVEDGLSSPRVVSLMNSSAGVAAITANEGYGSLVLHRFVGGRFVPVAVNLPGPVGGWGWGQFAVEDRDGAWWFPSTRGVWRFPRLKRFDDLARAVPTLVATRREGLDSDEIFRLWEDSRGDVWISAYGLARWERSTGRVETFKGTAADRYGSLPSAFAQDREGHVWIGDYSKGLVHYAAGSFEQFGPADGVPAGILSAVHVDRRGRLWVATSNGVAWLEHPDGRSRVFHALGTKEGLSSREVDAIVEDAAGGLYFAGGRGVDRYEPDTGRIDHLGSDDGLLGGPIRLALEGSDGALWFASPQGIARIAPSSHTAAPPPAVRIFEVRVAGEPHPLSPLGTTALDRIVLDPPRRRLDVEFAAVDASSGGSLRYEHRLDGGDGAWSLPSGTRAAELSNLAPGSYRFEARAVAADGRRGPAATIAFVVRPPVWRRPEIMAAAILAVGVAAWSGHRRRVARLIELERVRTRIATDLHDDLGASLSKIAITSEVVSAQLPPGTERIAERLRGIAETARDMVESLGDIVWTVDPRLDRLSDLTGRMRLFGGELLLPLGIEFELDAPDPAADRPLGADVRRGLYLAFKESLNNAVKHGRAGRVEARLAIEGGELVLRIRDDGTGFDPAAVRRGHGLDGLDARARGLGGRCAIRSAPGQGTEIEFRVPVRSHRGRVRSRGVD